MQCKDVKMTNDHTTAAHTGKQQERQEYDIYYLILYELLNVFVILDNLCKTYHWLKHFGFNF